VPRHCRVELNCRNLLPIHPENGKLPAFSGQPRDMGIVFLLSQLLELRRRRDQRLARKRHADSSALRRLVPDQAGEVRPEAADIDRTLCRYDELDVAGKHVNEIKLDRDPVDLHEALHKPPAPCRRRQERRRGVKHPP
jgi:hypothetical protein